MASIKIFNEVEKVFKNRQIKGKNSYIMLNPLHIVNGVYIFVNHKTYEVLYIGEAPLQSLYKSDTTFM